VVVRVGGSNARVRALLLVGLDSVAETVDRRADTQRNAHRRHYF